MEIQGLARYKEQFQLTSKAIIEPGLSRIEAALEKLGNPHKQLHVIHVAGTNGKGSTVGFLEQLACARQLQVGVFTSPAFIDVHDQIRVNGEHVTSQQLRAAFAQIADANIEGVTDFELLTIAAFIVFAQANVDVVCIEAGMGGLLDATNVVKPVVSVITTVALEHTNFLGDTVEAIAAHKAGIVKFGAPVVVGQLPEEAQRIVAQAARAARTTMYTYGVDFDVAAQTYSFDQLTIDHLVPSLHGAHQQHNMALAITAFVLFSERMKLHVSKKRVQQAVQQAHVPYRFEEIEPNVYMDGAHNVAGAEALVATIQQQLPNTRVHFVVGMLRDKNIDGVLRTLAPVAASFSYMSFTHERAATAETLQSLQPGTVIDALDDVKKAANGAPIIITGSLYLLALLVQK